MGTDILTTKNSGIIQIGAVKEVEIPPKNIQENNDATTLVISHQEKILDIADEIILMENGTIKKVGSKEEVISNINSKPCCKVGDMNE